MPEPSHSFSTEWWQGYHCLLPVTRNPYLAKPGSHQSEASEDWDDGWHTRFYGEGVDED